MNDTNELKRRIVDYIRNYDDGQPVMDLLRDCLSHIERLEKSCHDLETKLRDGWRCYNCRDGNTPLYCLNCAEAEMVRKGWKGPMLNPKGTQ